MDINCAEACVNGCVLGDQCPHLPYREAASKFIQDTPIDKILEIAKDSEQERFAKFLERASSLPSQLE